MSPHRELICDGFSPSLGAAAKTLNASRLDLIRSAITLTPSKISRMGYLWWMLSAYCEAHLLMTSDLKPTRAFAGLPISARATKSFWLAEALTHWFGMEHLKSTMVLPVERLGGRLVASPIAAPTPKIMPPTYSPPIKVGAKSAPDFVGIAGAKRHVLESKGRSAFGKTGVSAAKKLLTRNKALHQACRVSTIDGISPDTRSACVFSFEAGATSGWITDPDAIDANDLPLELPRLIGGYYDVVSLMLGEASRTSPGYVGVEFAPGWRFSIADDVLGRLLEVRDHGSAEDFVAFLSEREARPPRGARHFSLGADGLLLEGGEFRLELPEALPVPDEPEH